MKLTHDINRSCGDYEEYRLLGYKTLVRTWQKARYVSVTEPSRLMLCKFWDFSRRWLWRMPSSWIWKPGLYLTGNTLRLRYMDKPVNAKISGFHGGDYEECRLLAYKNPVHTSQETHYVSATEPSVLILSKIWDFHCDDCEGCLLGCYAMWIL
jgi:hypothetical protein